MKQYRINLKRIINLLFPDKKIKNCHMPHFKFTLMNDRKK